MTRHPETPPGPNMVWVPGGEFQMGSDHFYPEEGPVHMAHVDGFWMDKAPVTLEAFARFVARTDYTTVAERDLDESQYPGVSPEDLAAGSLVFKPTAGPVDLRNPGHWWHFVKGVHWRDPYGSGLTPPGYHPVTQVAFEDAQAYADWCGKSLPTEVQWEFAARGGLPGATFPWGNVLAPDGTMLANIWEGDFPWRSTRVHTGWYTSAVGSYPANDYGLFDMVGNVWEWTRDWWQDNHRVADQSACCAPSRLEASEAGSYDPDLPQIRIPRKVLKGGSHLCAANYCERYRPAARIPQMVDTATTHIGFRCVG